MRRKNAPPVEFLKIDFLSGDQQLAAMLSK
jgi:hypothetical protein